MLAEEKLELGADSGLVTELEALPPEQQRSLLLKEIFFLLANLSILATSMVQQGEEHPEPDVFSKWFCYLTNWQLLLNAFGALLNLVNTLCRNKPQDDTLMNMRLTISSLVTGLYYTVDTGNPESFYKHGLPALLNLMEAVSEDLPCEANKKAFASNLGFSVSYLGFSVILAAANVRNEGGGLFYKALDWRGAPIAGGILSAGGLLGTAVLTKTSEWLVRGSNYLWNKLPSVRGKKCCFFLHQEKKVNLYSWSARKHLHQMLMLLP